MTAQLLAGELSTLIQDTKRKAPEIRAAAEKSLSELKAISNTSESQLAADLRRRPEFIRPFLLACRASNPKFATPAVVSLQRLVAANGLAQERLEELLEALRDCSILGTDVQLRVLQIMPSLFQRYGEQISEKRLATALQVCFVLQAAKNAMISHTAAATLQQIVNDVFARVGTEKALATAASPDTSRSSWQAELDCHQVLQNLCLIAEGKPVESLRKANISKDFAIELIGTILLSHTAVIPMYSNFVDILRQQLLPLMLRVVSSSTSFPQTVRVLRLISPVVQGLLEVLPTELEMLLSMLTHMLEPDAAPTWKRTMCMEVMRDVYKEPANTRRMYALFDQKTGHKAIIQEQLAMLGRLAMEKPAVIGLGQNTSMPTVSEQTDEDFDGLYALQADPLTATTGVSLTNKVATNSGISTSLSTIKVALIDQLDKSEAPSVPQSYIYALVLSSLNLLCDGLAKFVLPFASSSRARLRKGSDPKSEGDAGSSDDDSEENQLPTNPLDLKGHPEELQIQAAAALLHGCWPALLSAYSTFFQAALDAEYYHATIRSFQKLIQVATLLRSATARDAFLTALSKQSLPSVATEALFKSEAPPVERGASVTSTFPPRLSPRNLLCLRALLNLGIALGAVLDEAWSIVLITLQQADIIVGHISIDRTLSKGGPASIAPTPSLSGELSKEFASEVAAVRSAASRMLGSASELPAKQYLLFLKLLDELLNESVKGFRDDNAISIDAEHPRGSSSNVNNNRTGALQGLRANVFVIDAFSQLIDLSKTRLGSDDPVASGWSSMIGSLMRLVKSMQIDSEVRFAAADAICKSVAAATFTDVDGRPESLVSFGFVTLHDLVMTVKSGDAPTSESSADIGNEAIHNAVLQTLKSCLDSYGETIKDGWNDVCELILSAFQHETAAGTHTEPSLERFHPYSQKLLRSSFSSLQVICSDLIDVLPHSCLSNVLQAVRLCCDQTLDLNVSLTSTSLYQSLSDSIWAGQNSLDIESLSSRKPSPRAGLWIQLLNAIAESTTSRQAEVRNSAVHACFRILHGIGDKLLPNHWSTVIENVVSRLFTFNEEMRSSAQQSTKANDLFLVLDETAGAIHNNTSTLLEDYLPMLLASDKGCTVWENLIHHMDSLLARKSLTLTTAVYSSLAKVFGTLTNEDSSFESCSALTWTLLLEQNAHNHIRVDRPASSDNQAALLSHISCATELYRVSTSEQRTQVAPRLLRKIAENISESTPTNYASDLTSTTPLQADCVKLLNYMYAATASSISPAFLEVLAELVSLSHEKKRKDATSKGPSFVAITKDVARLIEQFVRERGTALNLHENAEMMTCIKSLNLLIRHKRNWHREGNTIQVWKQASTSVLNVLSPLLTLALQREAVDNSLDIWNISLQVLDAILEIGEDSDDDDPNFFDNLLYDIDAFNRIYHLLVPSLGSDSRPGSPTDCSNFAKVLFLRSIIHDPHPDDSLDPMKASKWPGSERLGRVRDLDANPRTKLCYLLVDRLFEIVARAGLSEEYSRLAIAAAPYLRLRVALTLKAYISDQPLRGRMPCPLSQRKELIYLVQQSVSMDQHPGVTDEAKRLSQTHRQSLTSLVITALRVTKYSEQINEALLELIEVSAPQSIM